LSIERDEYNREIIETLAVGTALETRVATPNGPAVYD
jgi:hypothetical protein